MIILCRTTLVCSLGLFFNLLHINGALEDIEFDFNSPEKWKDIAPDCGGHRQSPINVEGENAINCSDPVTIKGMFSTPSKMTLGLIEHYVEMVIEYDQNPLIIIGGSLKGEYKITRAYFHWGDENGRGSEHAVNGKTGSMALIFIAHKAEYNDYTHALKKPDAFGAFLIIIDVTDDESEFNPGLKALLPKVKEMKGKNKPVQVDPYPLGEFMSKAEKQDNALMFLGYDGSMPEPPCRENVKWFINSSPQLVTQEFVDSFRALKSLPSSRGLQPVNGRQIYKVFASVE